MEDLMMSAKGYMLEKTRVELIDAGYSVVAINKDTGEPLVVKDDAILNGRLVICSGFSIPIEGNDDYLVLALD